jgi:hypothetical protein
VTRFLWWCAGADEQLLVRCPNSDRVKFQGLGGVVLATGFLAFLSGSYAFYTVFSPKVEVALDPLQKVTHWPSALAGVVAGLAWALVIFNLDRFIVASTGKGDGTDRITWGELGRAVPRILMALIIGVCLSAPLEIRILQSEIESHLQKVQVDEFQLRQKKQDIEWEKDYQRLGDKVSEAERAIAESKKLARDEDELVEQLGRRMEDEAAGTSGSGKRGGGPAFKEKKANFENEKTKAVEVHREETARQLKAERTKADLEATRATLLAQRADRDLQIKREVRGLDGLLERIKISHEIGGLVPWAIMCLLLSIELGPIFFKMMLIKGAYDYLDENQKKLASARAAIVPDSKLVPSDDTSNRAYHIDRFYGPEALLERERLALETTSQLTRQVHEEFRKVTAADIAKNPTKYLADDGSAPPPPSERT